MLADIESRYTDVGRAQVADDLKYLFTLAELAGNTFIATVGTTPHFNDGDPCTHSQNAYVGWQVDTIVRDSVFVDSDLATALGLDDEYDLDGDYWPEPIRSEVSKYRKTGYSFDGTLKPPEVEPPEVSKRIARTLSAMSHAIYGAYDTNTVTLVRRVNGDIVITTTETEPAY